MWPNIIFLLKNGFPYKEIKNNCSDYEKTIFVEEALHRLVEIHFHLGLEEEAKKYASILGYNYNTGEWFQQSYKVLNKNYNIPKNKKEKKERKFFDKIIELIK